MTRGSAIPSVGPANGVPVLSALPGWLIPWLLPVALMAWVHPLPIEEVRVVAVAWEMWDRGEFLVPLLNGLPYSHKPPGLQWLIHAGWMVFGVHAGWARLAASAGSLCAVALTADLARRLWGRSPAAIAAPWILAGTAGWVLFTPAIMYDTWLTAAVTAGLSGLLMAWHGNPRGWGIYALALAAGALAKGPVAMLFLLPAGALVPACLSGARPRKWNRRLVLATAAGVALVLLWAVPAAVRGGEDYAGQILWSQTAGRVVHSFAHQRPWWWYGPVVILLLLPWSLMPTVRAGLRRLWRDPGSRWILSWTLPALLLLSLIGCKQPHYVLPLLPGVALLASRALDTVRIGRIRRISIASALATTGLLGIALLATWEGYDVRPMAQQLQSLEQRGAPIAHTGAYHGQFHFAGRLHEPFQVLRSEPEASSWAALHPEGWIVTYRREPPPASAGEILAHRYRGQWAWLMPAAVWNAHGRMTTETHDPAC